MSESQIIIRKIGNATIQVPADEAFDHWLKAQLGVSIKPGRDVPKIGEVWPGEGGILAGLGRQEDGTPEWLISAPLDLGLFQEIQFGAYGTDVAGAKSWYDGRANTKALLAAGEHPAARKCADLEHEGHQDYFLGAKLQMATVYGALHGQVPKVVLWTSTQSSAYDAWYQDFGNGGTNHWVKDVKASALALRSISF